MPRVSTKVLGGPLSATQVRLLELFADGHLQKTAAGAIGRSQKTVEEHVNSVRVKLGARTVAHAVAIALRTGVIT